MTPTIWAPEIGAAVNVHHHVNATMGKKDGVTLPTTQNGVKYTSYSLGGKLVVGHLEQAKQQACC
jgi:hypothetical protein